MSTVLHMTPFTLYRSDISMLTLACLLVQLTTQQLQLKLVAVKIRTNHYIRSSNNLVMTLALNVQHNEYFSFGTFS